MSHKTDEQILQERQRIEAEGYSHASLVSGLFGILPFFGFMGLVAIILAIIAGKKGCYNRRRTAGIMLGIIGFGESIIIFLTIIFNLHTETYYF